MCRSRNFEPATYDSASEDGNYRKPAVFNQLGHPVPVARMIHSSDWLSALMLCQIKTRAKVSTLAPQNNRIHTFGWVRKELIHLFNKGIVHCISLIRSVEHQRRDIAVNFRSRSFAIAGGGLVHLRFHYSPSNFCCTGKQFNCIAFFDNS